MSELREKRDRHLKLGVLLASDGKVQARLWKRGEKAKDQDVDEEYAASGTWTRTERGYAVDVSVPLEPLRKALGARRSFLFDLVASDADEKGRLERGETGPVPTESGQAPASGQGAPQHE